MKEGLGVAVPGRRVIYIGAGAASEGLRWLLGDGPW